jgi:hypothetical protein
MDELLVEVYEILQKLSQQGRARNVVITITTDESEKPEAVINGTVDPFIEYPSEPPARRFYETD